MWVGLQAGTAEVGKAVLAAEAEAVDVVAAAVDDVEKWAGVLPTQASEVELVFAVEFWKVPCSGNLPLGTSPLREKIGLGS